MLGIEICEEAEVKRIGILEELTGEKVEQMDMGLREYSIVP